MPFQDDDRPRDEESLYEGARPEAAGGDPLAHDPTAGTDDDSEPSDDLLPPEETRTDLLAARVEVCLARDDRRGATAHLSELEEIARAHDSPGWKAEVLRWRGASLLARGRAAEAVGPLREAQARWRQMDVPYQVCRIAHDLALAYEALGDRETARREREAAAAALERLGAAEPAGDPPDLGGLTPRELEVVAAVADGRTNQQVARALGISERTVARHLANVYLKTQVGSRTGAVAWAHERGLI